METTRSRSREFARDARIGSWIAIGGEKGRIEEGRVSVARRKTQCKLAVAISYDALRTVTQYERETDRRYACIMSDDDYIRI